MANGRREGSNLLSILIGPGIALQVPVVIILKLTFYSIYIVFYVILGSPGSALVA